MKLSAAIVYAAFALIAVLAVPVCIFLGAIAAVWSVADRLIRKIEAYTK